MAETIYLPQPRLDSNFSVEQAFAQRRSVRNFSAAATPLGNIAQILWAAQGITAPDGLRTAPSAGALYPLEIILVAGNITGLAPGVYRYAQPGHTLTSIAAGDLRADLARAALEQHWLQAASAVLVFSALVERTTGKYGSRGVNYIYIEVGHAAQNVFLQARALGLGAAVVGAFDEARIAALVHLRAGERPLYLMPLGMPATN